MRRFKLTPLPTSAVPFELDGAEAHHLLHVLRAKVGDSVQMFDGLGSSLDCKIITCDSDIVRLEPIGVPQCQVSADELRTVLVMAQVKPKALDVVIRMATELGVTEFIIFPSAHSISREPKLERWSRLSVAAAKQCGRNTLPKLTWLPSLAEAWNAISDEITVRLVAHPNADSEAPTQSIPTAIFVGPEGGFRDDEVAWLCEHGAFPITLGQWVLRADTAATVAAAIMRKT